MRKYETTFILNPELEESAIGELIEKIKGIITNNNGEVVNVDNWGVRKLAYEIKKHNSGYYSVIQFNGTSETVAELQRNFRIMDNVLRHIIVRLDD
ncbi:30S ribosomal protein S6 [Anoxybacter fermentans]|uniref:Small ribosomal subunit protein bS6 n=1 Tax=Anoxybacter fermentans TaxID=1323375 RepID=A0A3S9T106_9FIRM|nr:30S ribosomal protein S6 [Anoxybacter fermentans]AZR74273.1 30S ribosomal protein S6 [Anoxybacter fermentans]